MPRAFKLCFQDLDNPYFHKTDFNRAAATNRCIEIIEAAGGFVERIWRCGYAEEIRYVPTLIHLFWIVNTVFVHSFTIPNGIEVPFKKDDPHFTATVLRTGKAIQWPTTLNRITPASADGGGVEPRRIDNGMLMPCACNTCCTTLPTYMVGSLSAQPR